MEIVLGCSGEEVRGLESNRAAEIERREKGKMLVNEKLRKAAQESKSCFIEMENKVRKEQ